MQLKFKNSVKAVYDGPGQQPVMITKWLTTNFIWMGINQIQMQELKRTAVQAQLFKKVNRSACLAGSSTGSSEETWKSLQRKQK